MIVTIGTNDTLASPGAQLDYYQSVIDKMGRAHGRSLRAVVRDAADRPRPERHELQRRRRRQDAPGRADSERATIVSALLFDWVEHGVAPGMSVTVTAGEKSLPLCSYPTYPKYVSGPAASASSYRCSQP